MHKVMDALPQKAKFKSPVHTWVRRTHANQWS